MPVHTAEFRLSTGGNAEMVDITDRVQAAVAEAAVAEGQATAFARGSTVAITTMEYEPGGVHDLQALLDRLIPARGDYEHNRLNHDTNSHAHQRASIIGASEVVPVQGGRLALGTWQQLVMIDFDDHPRERTVLVQVIELIAGGGLRADRDVRVELVDRPTATVPDQRNGHALTVVGAAGGNHHDRCPVGIDADGLDVKLVRGAAGHLRVDAALASAVGDAQIVVRDVLARKPCRDRPR